MDTGSSITVVDLSLAAELRLNVQDSANVLSSDGSYASASFAQVDSIEAGSHAVANQAVLVYDLQKLNSVIQPVRGILGEDFLERFDMLIDNAHHLLCLDDSAALRANVKGPLIALVTSAKLADGQPAPHKLIVETQILNGKRPLRLILDSGSNVPVLYNVSQSMTRPLIAATPLEVMQAEGAQRAFLVVLRQEVKIGSLDLPGVLFVTPRVVQTTPNLLEDGLLPTGLFRRVFIDHLNHSAILEPK